MRIAVFCGSAAGGHPGYRAAAEELGDHLARQGIDLVFGGSAGGLMGAIADSVLAAGGRAYGVLPQHLAERGIGHPGVTGMTLVAGMHERKATMAELADAFVAIPGGTGTLEELFEVWNHAILGLHRKPVAILNIGGFYDKLCDFLADMLAGGFVTAAGHRLLHVTNSPAETVTVLAAAIAPARI